jgi:hypothetical protein
MVNCHHTPLHFPLDTINAVSKSVLPPGHALAQTLAPHFRFSLPLNEAALYSKSSILQNNAALLYSPFATDKESVYRLTCMGYGGIPGNSAYPRWRYSPTPEPIMGDYGVFLQRYYDATLDFTRHIAAAIQPGDAAVSEWADAIASFLPGFPDSSEIADRELLARVIAKTIWSASVAHAADHHDFGNIPIGKIPLRLRVPPPSRAESASGPRKSPGRWSDAVRHEMARVLFFREDTVTRLIDVRYGFTPPSLQSAGRDFVKRLHEVDATLPVRRFIPLEKIPASIQF